MFDLRLFADVANKIKSSTTSTSILALKKTVFADETGKRFIAIQQNPDTGSKWAALARSGKNVVQIKSEQPDKYVAVVVDGEVTVYPEHK
jgi:hypothetical protein